MFTVFLSARPVRGERSHEPRARASDRAPETIDRALVVDASNATMAGDGFVPNRGALDAAADAAESMWWWDAPSEAWRTRRARMDAASGTKSAVSGADVDDWVPWAELLDASEAPYFRWFHGARTNACFNAVDRHCLEGRGDDCAMTILPEEVTPTNPRVNVTRRELLGAVAAAAKELRDAHGLRPRDRVLFHMPTDATHCAYMLACQRIGVTYSATAADSVEDVLASRVADLRPALVIAYDAPVLHGGVPIDCAAKLRRAAPDVPFHAPRPWSTRAKDLPRWAAMTDARALVAAQKLAPCLPCASDHPLFVSYTSGSTGKPKGVVHGHGGYVSGVLATMSSVFECVPGEGADGVSGGILTVGSSGWITGQSYMLMGPLLAAVRSVMMVGSPVYPAPTRALATVAAERCSVLKTGSAVVRQLMTDPNNAAKIDAIDTSSLRCATFCAEPVSVEVHRYAHAHVTRNFINSYWATEHGGMVFSRDVRRRISDNAPDTRAWPLPWVSVALDPESSDVVITGPYPSLALTVFGSPESVNDPSWRGDLAKYASTYWPANAGGFVQGDVARAAGKDGAYTFHGRSDEVINVNGNRVGTEQIERRLWGVETPAAATATKTRADANGVASAADGSTNGDAKEAAAAAGAKARAAGVGPGGGAGATSEWTVGDGFRVRDCCVVGAPDFVKGTAPVAFVVFEPKRGSKLPPGAVPDVNAFRAAAASTVAAGVGAYAAPDHVFAVDALPKTITNKTARKTLQLLLAGLDAPSGSLARREVLPPIASAVREWRLTGATTSQRVDLTRYWRQFTFDDHNVQGRPIVPGAGWLCLLAHEMGSERLADVAFMRGVHDADADVRVVKRRRVMQATVGDDVILRASTSSGAAAPAEIGPAVFDRSAVPRAADASDAAADMDTGGDTSSDDVPDARVTDDSTSEQHYRRCDALRLNYGGAYRAVRKVEWSGHAFRADVDGTHLAAVLDAGLQVVCAAVRANTFIPVGVKEFHIAEGVEAWTPGARCVVHGEILEQHPEFLVADVRYERVVAKPIGNGRSPNGKRKGGAGTDARAGETYVVFAAMGRVRFARVEGSRPRLQPASTNKRAAETGRAQILDPKTALARLRQLTLEQRVESIRSVVRAVVSDLTDAEVDFEKTVFDNGMHSLNAVELLSRVNESLGTGVTTKLVVPDAPMSDFVVAVAEHAMTYVAPDEGDADARPFPNVDYDGLNEVIRRRLAGKSVGQTPYFFLAKYFAYNWFKKAFQFFRIGGHRFVLNPPREINLGVEVSMNRRVEFRDIDMNQHYTVEMIVARSVDGVEQLMARAGLSHVELYYKRNIFAAKIQSTFHKELALGDRYIIRTKITKVTGSLMDIRVAFLDKDEVLCFEILWTILIVLDSTERILLDWENIDLMEGKRLRAGPGKTRVEAPPTPKSAVKTAKSERVEA